MKFPKVLWLDFETTGLDTEYTNVTEIAYLPEINGEPDPAGVRHLLVQPVLHWEDKIYGQESVQEFLKKWNKTLSKNDPNYLQAFSFPESDPLFVYAKGALTFNLDPPQVRDPAQWLLDPDRMTPQSALNFMKQDLAQFDSTYGRWTIAGQNAQYDLDVLMNWVPRLLDENEAKAYVNMFNSYYVLDLVALVRWLMYAGHITTRTAKLEDVASFLGMNFDAHRADQDITTTWEAARKLLAKFVGISP